MQINISIQAVKINHGVHGVKRKAMAHVWHIKMQILIDFEANLDKLKAGNS
jgi:hypothetical protein